MVCIYLPNENWDRKSWTDRYRITTSSFPLRMVVLVAGRAKRVISCSKHPDRLCGPPSLISLGSEGTFPDVTKLITRPQLLPKLEWIFLYFIAPYVVCPAQRPLAFWVMRSARTIHLSEVSKGLCACIFKVTNWFMWMGEQCFIETPNQRLILNGVRAHKTVDSATATANTRNL